MPLARARHQHHVRRDPAICPTQQSRHSRTHSWCTPGPASFDQFGKSGVCAPPACVTWITYQSYPLAVSNQRGIHIAACSRRHHHRPDLESTVRRTSTASKVVSAASHRTMSRYALVFDAGRLLRPVSCSFCLALTTALSSPSARGHLDRDVGVGLLAVEVVLRPSIIARGGADRTPRHQRLHQTR